MLSDNIRSEIVDHRGKNEGQNRVQISIQVNLGVRFGDHHCPRIGHRRQFECAGSVLQFCRSKENAYWLPQPRSRSCMVSQRWGNSRKTHDCLRNSNLNMLSWFTRRQERIRRSRGRATLFPMTDREREILERELRDSARNAIVTPLDSTSSGDGIYDQAAKMELNQAIRGGDCWNVGIPSQSLDETKRK